MSDDRPARPGRSDQQKLMVRGARLLVALVVVAAAAYFGVPLATSSAPGSGSGQDPGTGSGAASSPAPSGDGGGAATASLEESQVAVVALMREQRSGVMVTFDARVARTISDDNEGSRHQRFILAVEDEGAPRGTILVAHNIDLAPRVPVEAGDIVGVYGQYEYNEQGGVVHWTHHDPGGRRAGGWIELDGVRYE